LAIILAAYFLGELLRIGLHLPVPGTILGLLLLFAGLQTGLIKTEMIEETCEFLLAHMPFFFVPAAVGLMVSMHLLAGKWLLFVVLLVASTVLVWLATLYAVKWLRRGTQ
jgi:holin-like protein